MRKGHEIALGRADLMRAVHPRKMILSIFAVALCYYVGTLQQESPEDVFSIYWDTIESSFSILIYSICAITYGTGFCEDMEHGFIKQVLVRRSKAEYILSKQLSIFISSFITYCLGNTLFLLVVKTRYPVVSEFGYLPDVSDTAASHLLGMSSTGIPFFAIAVGMYGLLCGILAVLASYVSFYLNNRMVVICIPMVFYYFIINILDRYFHIPRVFNPAYLYDILYDMCGGVTRSILWAILYSIIIGGILYGMTLRKVRRMYQ